MEKSTEKTVLKLLSLQDELITKYRLCQYYIEHNSHLVNVAKEEIERLEDEIKTIKVNRMSELIKKGL